MQRAFGERMAPPASMARVLADGRQGRKTKRGFYTYDGKRQARGRDRSTRCCPTGAARRRASTPREIQERLVFAFLNEVRAAACRRGSCARRATATWAPIFGLGFPPFLGGPFRYLDHLGARFAVETLERLARRTARASAPRLLVDMAREGRTLPCHASDLRPRRRPGGMRA